MRAEELALILAGTSVERSSVNSVELVVTLRKPDEIEALASQIASLNAENAALRAQLLERDSNRMELLGAYERLKRARKILKKNGLQYDFLEF